MSVKGRAVTIAATATRIDSVAEDRTEGSGLVFYNNGSQTVFVGGSDVTVANGLPVSASSFSPGYTFPDGSDELYGIVAATTCEIRVNETGV